MQYEAIKRKAREMRKNPTPAEDFMWQKVRRRQLGGFKFHRQYILKIQLLNAGQKFFIVDFYNSVNKLVIEVDGKIHLKQLEKDKARESLFKTAGFSVLRFKNDQVLNRWDEVEKSIITFINRNMQKPSPQF